MGTSQSSPEVDTYQKCLKDLRYLLHAPNDFPDKYKLNGYKVTDVCWISDQLYKDEYLTLAALNKEGEYAVFELQNRGEHTISKCKVGEEAYEGRGEIVSVNNIKTLISLFEVKQTHGKNFRERVENYFDKYNKMIENEDEENYEKNKKLNKDLTDAVRYLFECAGYKFILNQN